MMIFQNAKRSKKVTIKQNKPIASVNANPKIAYENNCCFNEGFLAYELIKAPKTVPIPTPVTIKNQSNFSLLFKFTLNIFTWSSHSSGCKPSTNEFTSGIDITTNWRSLKGLWSCNYWNIDYWSDGMIEDTRPGKCLWGSRKKVNNEVIFQRYSYLLFEQDDWKCCKSSWWQFSCKINWEKSKFRCEQKTIFK